MLDKFLHDLNVSEPIATTELGIVIVVKFVQSLNVLVKTTRSRNQ